MLTTTLGSFAVHGMTYTLPAVQGVRSPKNIIVKLTDKTMVWRNPLHGSGLRLNACRLPLP